MSEFFLGQVMMTGFNFAPKYWAQCNGQLLPIAQNQALFSLLGTQFGGDGINTFALPDLRSRTPTGYGSSVDSSWQPPAVQMGQAAGSENVTLLPSNLPARTTAMPRVACMRLAPAPERRCRSTPPATVRKFRSIPRRSTRPAAISRTRMSSPTPRSISASR